MLLLFYICLWHQPIFLLLPLLEASASHFTSRQQLLSENPQFHALQECRNLDLRWVCEVKVAGDEAYYKLNTEKLNNWLKGRVARLQAVLDAQNICGSNLVRVLF